MSAVSPVPESTGAKLASLMLAPRFVLAVIWSAIIVGAVTSMEWAAPLFWAVIVLTASATVFALAGAKPLPALAQRSHLFLRLSWLTRYSTATTVLCLSTFLGALAGSQAGVSRAQTVVDGVGGLLGIVVLWAAKVAAVLFFGWLVIDVHRMSEVRRRKGIQRAIRKALPRELRGLALNRVVLRWLVTLSSRVVATVSLCAIVIALLIAY